MVSKLIHESNKSFFGTLVVCALFFVPVLSLADTSSSTDPFPVETVDLYINKHISGEDLGFKLSDFLYRVKGDGVDAIVSHDSKIPLRPGTYTIEELVPTGFVKSDWRIGWYGQCESGSEYTTAITIEERHLDFGTLYCEADNQFRPENNSGPNNPQETNATGTIVVSKIVVGTSTSPDEFSFTVHGGDAVAFEADGENNVEVASGTYAVTEVAVAGYDVAYSSGCSGVISGGDSVNCVITNTWEDNDSDDGGGGDGADPDLYRIIGYVWHDDNENTEWDGFQDEIATTTEEELISWTVQITNGTDTFATTTDPDGYYWFEVPAGTWTITEVLEDGWSLITPVSGSFIITVPEGDVELTFFQKVQNFLLPIAYAAVVDTYGPYNFGNNESSDGGGTSTDNNNSGGGSGGSSSGGGATRPQCALFTRTSDNGHFVLTWETKLGNEVRITQNGSEIFFSDLSSIVESGSIFVTTDAYTHELIVTRGSKTDNCVIEPVFGVGGGFVPEPQVLGEQVLIVPVGAPAAGAGGGAPMTVPSPVFAHAVVIGPRALRHRRFG